MERPEDFDSYVKVLGHVMASEAYVQSTPQQRTRILQKRIKKFYSGNHIDVSSEHFKPRIQPVYEEHVYPVPHTLILFGIDFLTITQIKQTFSSGDPSFEFTAIDESNCILKYSNKEYARRLIKANILKDSSTYFKMEEGQQLYESMRGTGLQIENEPPREWIELNPYTYRHYYRNQKLFPDQFQDYQRKLYIRYATNKEKDFGIVTIYKVDDLLTRCKKIWMMEAGKTHEMRQRIEKKMKKLNDKKNNLFRGRRTYSQCSMRKSYHQENNNNGYKRNTTRSRSRDDKYKKKTNQNQSKNNQNKEIDLDESFLVGKDDFRDMNDEKDEEDLLNQSIICEGHKANQLNQLVNLIDDFNKSLDGISEISAGQIAKQLEDLNLSRAKPDFINLPYKMAEPHQFRFRKNKETDFNYQEYMKNIEAISERTIKYQEIDLTTDD